MPSDKRRTLIRLDMPQHDALHIHARARGFSVSRLVQIVLARAGLLKPPNLHDLRRLQRETEERRKANRKAKPED